MSIVCQSRKLDIMLIGTYAEQGMGAPNVHTSHQEMGLERAGILWQCPAEFVREKLRQDVLPYPPTSTIPKLNL